ncbi:MAG: hypothetical protein K6G10_10790 [Butyrivibrio sp.]|nr:hypothetical protein [Butyrivibrio sp.]
MTLAMVFSVAACGAKDDSGNGDKDIVVSTQTDQPEDVAEDVEEDVAVDEESILTVDNKAQTTVENEIEEISFSILDDGKEVLEKLGEPRRS